MYANEMACLAHVPNKDTVCNDCDINTMRVEMIGYLNLSNDKVNDFLKRVK